MKHLGTFHTYQPNPRPEWAQGDGVENQILFARNATGEDWYELRQTLPEGATLVGVDVGSGYANTIVHTPDMMGHPGGMDLYMLEDGEEAPEIVGDLRVPGPALEPGARSETRLLRLYRGGEHHVFGIAHPSRSIVTPVSCRAGRRSPG